MDAEILLMEVDLSQQSHIKMGTGGSATVPSQELREDGDAPLWEGVLGADTYFKIQIWKNSMIPVLNYR